MSVAFAQGKPREKEWMVAIGHRPFPQVRRETKKTTSVQVSPSNEVTHFSSLVLTSLGQSTSGFNMVQHGSTWFNHSKYRLNINKVQYLKKKKNTQTNSNSELRDQRLNFSVPLCLDPNGSPLVCQLVCQQPKTRGVMAVTAMATETTRVTGMEPGHSAWETMVPRLPLHHYGTMPYTISIANANQS